jgi:hypothetical protein
MDMDLRTLDPNFCCPANCINATGFAIKCFKNVLIFICASDG